jgi:hypothetical protein
MNIIPLKSKVFYKMKSYIDQLVEGSREYPGESLDVEIAEHILNLYFIITGKKTVTKKELDYILNNHYNYQ